MPDMRPRENERTGLQEKHVGRSLIAILAMLCALVLVAYTVFLYYYNVFFFEGDEYDLNIFAHLIWRNDTFNYLPHFQSSFFSIHLSPFLYVVNQLSYLAPASQEGWFSGFMASIHASFVPVFFFLWWRVTMRRPANSPTGALTSMALGILGAVLAVAFALNGTVLNAMSGTGFVLVRARLCPRKPQRVRASRTSAPIRNIPGVRPQRRRVEGMDDDMEEGVVRGPS